MPHKHIEGYPSVTEILSVISKPFLYRWYGKHGTEKCEAIKASSQKIGTAVHNELEQLITGIEFKRNKNKTIRLLTDNFMAQWWEPNEVELVSSEVTLKDEIYKYQGTFDAILRLQGKLLIADWKTSNQFDNSMPLQLAAYARLTHSEINEGV